MNSKKEAARKLAHTARESLAGRMKVAGRVVDRIYDHELKPYGVTISQFGLLSVILLLEDPTPTQIGEMMSMEKSTLSRNLKLMEQEGWVKLESHGRNLHIQVTRLGCEVYCKSAEGWKRAQVAMKQVLKEEGVDAVQLVASILKSN